MSSLEIYRASAGSGKTFRIVREYLKMVIEKPSSYKNILAVTFTNKATAEMKDRILRELASLASNQPSAHLGYLIDLFGWPESQVRSVALKVMNSILHDYSRFSVSTIDSFFQRVIRSFSREMRLNASYRTEIDVDTVLEQAIDRLFMEIDEQEAIRNWLFEYADQKLKSGSNWNFKSELLARGGDLFNEEFKQFGEALLEKLADKAYLTRYGDQLRGLVQQYENRLVSMGKEAIDLISACGLTLESFKYGKASFASHFYKLANENFDVPSKRCLDAQNNVAQWCKAGDKNLIARVEQAYHQGLNALLVDSIGYMTEFGPHYATASAILDNLFSFGLLTDIALKVQEIAKEKNIVLLSDSTQLLRKVIDGSDSPFVYEKLGSVYRHFMLDEFQDTSRMQWHNFRPLILNSLSEGNRNILVGDVKQSIYRWRNGDWGLLASQVERDLKGHEVNISTLDTNWRSSKMVIGFNNSLFREASNAMNQQFESSYADAEPSPDSDSDLKGMITNAYHDHFQKFSGKEMDQGYVRLEFLEEASTKKHYQELVLELLVSRIEEIQTGGIAAKDIAVLVRNRSEGTLVVNALQERNQSNPQQGCIYDVISNDSLLISQSSVVRFVVNLLYIHSGKDDEILKAELIYHYYTELFPSQECESGYYKDIHQLFKSDRLIPEIFRLWFPDQSGNMHNLSVRGLSLFELITQIISHFHLDQIPGEVVYLDSFLNLVMQYNHDQSGDLSGFLEHWENVSSKISVNLSKDQNAISVLTIHKSKGLEFPIVLIPFCNWELIPTSTKLPMLWCHPETEPFQQLDLVLVKYSKKLKQSIFRAKYFEELLYSMVDNLNLLYVATTRAVAQLYLFAPYAEKIGAELKTVGQLLQYVVENRPMLDSKDRENYLDLNEFWNGESKIMEMGERCISVKGEKLTLSDAVPFNRMKFSRHGQRMTLRIHHDGFVQMRNAVQADRIEHGKLMHEIFELISTCKDVEPALKKVFFEGKIDAELTIRYKILIDELLQHQPFVSWFSGNWRVLNEREILRGKVSRHRPDRVMIKDDELIVVDYKTGSQSDHHISQVRGYMKDFHEMGFHKVQGFVWYLGTNDVIPVN